MRKEQADLLGVEFDTVSIEPMFDAFMDQLSPMFKGVALSIPQKKIYKRVVVRLFLMAMSNKRRRLVLTTSNKVNLP